MLEQANSWSIHHLLCQRRLRWLGHVHYVNDGCMTKDICGELVTGHDRPPHTTFQGRLQEEPETYGHRRW